MCEPRILRDLTQEDVDALDASHWNKGVKPPRIKKLRDSHHQLAMLLVTGITDTEAAERAGYTLSRVSILKADPTFQELMSHYRGIREAAFASAQDKMASLLTDFVDELRERVEENPEEIPTPLVLQAIEKLADRTGNGPRSTQVNVNVNLAARLGAARQRVAALGDAGMVIDMTPPLPAKPGGIVTDDLFGLEGALRIEPLGEDEPAEVAA